MSVKN
jgi:hypothetical protein